MSKDKIRARHARLQFVARAASASGLATGIEAFPPSDDRTIVRLEREGLIARRRVRGSSWGGKQNITFFRATPAGLEALAAAGRAPTGVLSNGDRRTKAQIERSHKSRSPAIRTDLPHRIAAAERAELLRSLAGEIGPFLIETPSTPGARYTKYFFWKAFVRATGFPFSWADFQKHFAVEAVGETARRLVIAT